jgi:predicted nuclease of predicted toxin-antitoxin system
MRFLADESCDANISRALQEAGHDVVLVSRISPRADDASLVDLARNENRLLLTEDKDFGQLFFASNLASNGVILFRYPFQARSVVIQTLLELIEKRGEELLNRFVVVQPGRIRINPPLASG